MYRLMAKIMLSAALLLTLCGTAAAEVVKGKIKALAGEAKLFTLQAAQERVFLISWDNQTAWRGIKNAADLRLDEILTVDFSLRGDSAVAASVARLTTPVPAGVKTVSLDVVVAGVSAREGSRPLLLVDTRPVELYDAGHIPGAVSLPLARLEKRTSGLLPEERDSRLVFYDEGQGGESAGKGAELAARAGYSEAAVFPDGLSGWTAAGRYLAASTAYLRKIKPAIVDVRTHEQVALGHIEGAVNYPLAGLKQYYGYFPMERAATIVVYGETDKDAVAAADIIRNWGYKNVTIYPGGAAAWVENAEVLKSGPAGEQIFSVAATHGGKLKANDFEMALISPVMVQIVDVRSAADRKTGGFPKSINIPLQELAARHGELDRDKIQVVFAADAARAEMAYDFLKSKGYRVNYLNGYVEFGKDGKYILK